jgi:hypothetical protein
MIASFGRLAALTLISGESHKRTIGTRCGRCLRNPSVVGRGDPNVRKRQCVLGTSPRLPSAPTVDCESAQGVAGPREASSAPTESRVCTKARNANSEPTSCVRRCLAGSSTGNLRTRTRCRSSSASDASRCNLEAPDLRQPLTRMPVDILQLRVQKPPKRRPIRRI